MSLNNRCWYNCPCVTASKRLFFSLFVLIPFFYLFSRQRTTLTISTTFRTIYIKQNAALLPLQNDGRPEILCLPCLRLVTRPFLRRNRRKRMYERTRAFVKRSNGTDQTPYNRAPIMYRAFDIPASQSHGVQFEIEPWATAAVPSFSR